MRNFLNKAVKIIILNTDIIKNTALHTIKIEQEAILQLYDSINQDFVDATISIYKSTGRVVVTGIGKSAIVGQKIVATLNSTGTPALFMHAADAIHGDLGMIRKEDIVLCISKSGNTSEIKLLLPLLKRLENIIIGMVSEDKSYLALHADYVLLTPLSQEADPNNLAPTTSTTLQMIMGDALATSLLALKGFSPQDFAKFHPGGILGKHLYLTVADLYPQNEKPQVSPHTPLKDVILEISKKRLGIAVVAQDEKVVGVITDGDLRRMLSENQNIEPIVAKEVMSIDPKTIPHDELAVNALRLMQDNSITQIVVLKNEKYVGVVHIHDLIREGLV